MVYLAHSGSELISTMHLRKHSIYKQSFYLKLCSMQGNIRITITFLIDGWHTHLKGMRVFKYESEYFQCSVSFSS